MSTLVIDRRHISLSYEADCLYLRGEKMPVKTIPLRALRQIICCHSIKMESSLLGQLKVRGIDFMVLNSRYPERSIDFPSEPLKKTMRKRGQYHVIDDSCSASLIQRTLLDYKWRCQSKVFRDYGASEGVLAQADQLRLSMQKAAGRASLMGLEGQLAALSMQFWVPQYDPKWQFHKRVRRPPTDPVNALLSLTYSILYRESANILAQHGLDPVYGCYHQNLSGRYSLACDLMEPIRPLVEAWVFQQLHVESLLQENHFNHTKSGCLLNAKGRPIYYTAYEPAAVKWRRLLHHYARAFLHFIQQQTHCD
jgi:CRISPR-associated protein Cas1